MACLLLEASIFPVSFSLVSVLLQEGVSQLVQLAF